jgi:hypothetical protein
LVRCLKYSWSLLFIFSPVSTLPQMSKLFIQWFWFLYLNDIPLWVMSCKNFQALN